MYVEKMVRLMETEELVQKQIEEMSKHKWIESEKAGYDLGQDAMLDWVDKYLDPVRDKNLNRKRK
jgi:hypothetical protein